MIDKKAFWKCSALVNVEFGNKLRSIGGYAFYKCINIQSLDIPFVRKVGRRAFQDCVGLTYAVFGDKLERINMSFDG
jgi:hypothetical protein